MASKARRPAAAATARGPRGIDRLGSSIGLTHTTQTAQAANLALYDAACRALSEAVSVDEVMSIRDEALQMEACARIAKNHQVEADAVALRMRATRRLGQLCEAQKNTVGFNRGAAGGGKKAGPRGLLVNPRDLRPTLASQGIDKTLAHQARVLRAMDEAAFEHKVVEARVSAARVFRRAVREAEIVQEREAYAARIERGGTVADLRTLIEEGRRFGVLHIDFPLRFEVRNVRGEARTPQSRYDCMTIDEIIAWCAEIPLTALVCDSAAAFVWVTWPYAMRWHEIVTATGFEYSACAFLWEKINADGSPSVGNSLSGTQANTEACLLLRRGSPRRLAMDVPQVIRAPVTEHSAKPEEARDRIERLFPGPYLELFARKPREGWTTWGNEIERHAAPPDPDCGEMPDIPDFLRRTQERAPSKDRR
jgi:N6-adenosine-specific RNA methylase IME4